jgi:hypothetical protein
VAWRLGSHSIEMAGGERSEGARGMVVSRRWRCREVGDELEWAGGLEWATW